MAVAATSPSLFDFSIRILLSYRPTGQSYQLSLIQSYLNRRYFCARYLRKALFTQE